MAYRSAPANMLDIRFAEIKTYPVVKLGFALDNSRDIFLSVKVTVPNKITLVYIGSDIKKCNIKIDEKTSQSNIFAFIQECK